MKLGIDVAERTVSRLMPKRRPQPSQPWRTFLANHVPDLVSIDFFTVPTAGLRVLSLLFKPSRCMEELRPFVKRLRHGFDEHPVWTNLFRVECQTQGAGRPK